MRRWVVTLCAMAVLLGAMTMPAFAAHMNCKKENPVCGYRTSTNRFADVDNDGICDNKSDKCRINFTDANDDGICDHKMSGGRNCFTDKDNDGICDNRGENQTRSARNCGANGGHGRGHGKNK